MSYDFKFSVLMPIYNVEKYLSESIDSLINQSIGFEQNVELVIIDDGSPDSSKDIALKYQETYPNNIKVFSKSNGGQASAFNFGLDHLHGKYISFLDSDDFLSLNTLLEVYNFFEQHYDEIDLVSIPVMFFERRSGGHMLNYKFDSTRVIDLIKEPYYPQLSIASAFIKNESLKGLEFNTELIAGYDTLMVNKILLQKKKYGVISSCYYNYRKRLDATSTIDNYKQNREFFTHSLKNLDINLMDYYKEKIGNVPKFIQYVVAYDVQWFYTISNLPEYFTKDETNEFWETFYHVLSYIDEDVLNDSRIIRRNYVRSFLMYLKNKKEFHIDTVEDQSEIYLKSGEYTINNLHNHRIYIDSIRIKENILRIYGTFTSSCDSSTLKFKAIKTLPNGEKEIFNEVDEFVGDDSYTIRILGIDWYFKHYFNFEIPVEKEESKIELKILYNENDKEIWMKNKTTFRESSILADMINYYVEDSRIISFKENSFNICPYSFEKAHELKQELLLYIQDILESEKNLKRENKILNKDNKKLNNKNQSLNKKNEKLKAQLKKSNDKNKEILNSTSWKITKPIRMPKLLIKKMKK
ncbi:MAG: glycosyltransferase family 2 protein [Methanobrevibacter ruminantium]|uniref:glycosyltransferase family 2 protein n=1 Tax=Methanobrevibacter ruminantium TaxID=83816 RepID=UPI0026EA424C|nr:glycosyltransferase family 2 protein [Methanobrevibacter ruminantium]MDO5841908.1 glycosyltransferase family 2 protein [Methanobrevibacter ruminantium]